VKDVLDKALPMSGEIVDFVMERTADPIVAFTALGVAREHILMEVKKTLSGDMLDKFNEAIEKIRRGEQSGVALAEAADFDPTKIGHGGDA
jgi:hypothetical protein